MTLFDTGASSGNFEQSIYCLRSNLILVNKKVKVANETRVNIDAKIMLGVSFDTQREMRKACLEFNVMDGLSLDLIIGLPAICNHFRESQIHA